MTMNNNNKGGFLNGFLWGAIVGGIVIFLLTSKKGKKLLKFLTEEGLDGVSELEELFGEKISGDDYEEETVSSSEKIYADKPMPSENSALHKLTSTGRRFFRGVPRRN